MLAPAAIVLFCAGGCAFDALLRTTASLGGNTAGQRGNVEVLFINNTPFRAVFTFGTYDNLDQDSMPQLQQFSSDTQTMNLEGDSQSAILQIPCARVFSIGGQGLITRVRNQLDDGQFQEEALVPGVNFSSAAVGDDDADAATEGTAAPHTAFIGSDFECNALVIYRFEFSDVGPREFEIDMSVIPSESTR